jgi:heme exporter protein C
MGQRAQTLPRPATSERARDRPVSAAPDRLGAVARWLGPLAALAMLAMLYAAMLYAPTERTQGHAQRILYPHIGTALVMYLAYAVTFVGSLVYLWRRSERADLLARCSAEVGLLFTTIVLVTGAIWGKGIWGTWWSWDARLTSTLVLWFIYAGYLMLRAYGGDTARMARSAAVIAIVGVVDLPIIHLSVRWWRTLHPAPIVVRERPALPPEMGYATVVALLAFLLLYAYLLVQRLRAEQLRVAVGALRQRALFEEGAGKYQ